jgi:hypothetical protein
MRFIISLMASLEHTHDSIEKPIGKGCGKDSQADELF